MKSCSNKPGCFVSYICSFNFEFAKCLSITGIIQLTFLINLVMAMIFKRWDVFGFFVFFFRAGVVFFFVNKPTTMHSI